MKYVKRLLVILVAAFLVIHWNLAVSENDSNLIDYSNQALFFTEEKAFFYNEEMFVVSNAWNPGSIKLRDYF